MNHDPDMTGQVIVDPLTVRVATPDVVALRNLQTYSATELQRVQKRSDKWISGLVAVTGVLTTAVVIKGPDSFTKLSDSRTVFGITFAPQDWIVGLMLVGGVAIAFGIVKGYNAAYGDPLKDDALAARAKEQEVDGAWKAWTEATEHAASEARGALKVATYATIGGTFALALAVFLTWTTPSQAPAEVFTCLQGPSGIVKIEGAAPIVSEGRLEVVPCP